MLLATLLGVDTYDPATPSSSMNCVVADVNALPVASVTTPAVTELALSVLKYWTPSMFAPCEACLMESITTVHTEELPERK